MTKRETKKQHKDRRTIPPDNGKDKTKTQDKPRKDNINTRLKETNKDNTKKKRQDLTRVPFRPIGVQLDA